MNLKKPAEKIVNIGTSNRHAHLTQDTILELFGKEKLEILKELSQPGQFAAKETIELIGPEKTVGQEESRVNMKGVRVLGPSRKENQIELSLTDARQLGIKNIPTRLSGVLSESPGIILKGPKGQVKIEKGVIISQKHLHIEPRRAEQWGIKDNDLISVGVKSGLRSGIMSNILVRVSDSAGLDIHVDTDEGNAFALGNNAKGLVLLTDEEILDFIKNHAK